MIFKTCALKIDTDRSGEISVNELSKIIKHLEFDCVDDEVREIMNLLDKNGVCFVIIGFILISFISFKYISFTRMEKYSFMVVFKACFF